MLTKTGAISNEQILTTWPSILPSLCISALFSGKPPRSIDACEPARSAVFLFDYSCIVQGLCFPPFGLALRGERPPTAISPISILISLCLTFLYSITPFLRPPTPLSALGVFFFSLHLFFAPDRAMRGQKRIPLCSFLRGNERACGALSDGIVTL